jgi:hypothetical protein
MPRGLLLFHHCAAYVNGLLLVIFPMTAFVKGATVLVYCITFEAFLFVGLVCYRLYPLETWTPKLLKAGMVIFGLSRPAQFAWIVAGIAVTWNDLILWQAVIQLVFASGFTALQFYTLSIHYSLLKQLQALVKKESKRLGLSNTSENFSSRAIQLVSMAFDEADVPERADSTDNSETEDEASELEAGVQNPIDILPGIIDRDSFEEIKLEV